MNRMPIARSPARRASLAGIVASLAVSFAAGAATPPADKFLPGWQDNAHALIYDGERQGGSAWRVPDTLDRGTYRILERDAHGVPHLVPRQRFAFKGTTGERFLVYISTPVRSPEVIDERYVAVEVTSPDTQR